MPTCKYNVKKGGGRYSHKCGADTQKAIVFTTAIDEAYLVTTQMPVCSEHYEEKTEVLNLMGITWHVIAL